MPASHWGSSDAQDENPYGMDYDGNADGDGSSIFDAWDSPRLSATGASYENENPVHLPGSGGTISVDPDPTTTVPDYKPEHDHPITQESEEVQDLFSFGAGVGDTYETLDEMIADDEGVWEAAESLRYQTVLDFTEAKNLLHVESNTEGLRAAMTRMQRAIVEACVRAARSGKENEYVRHPQEFFQQYLGVQASQEDLIAMSDLGSNEFHDWLDLRFDGWEAGIGDNGVSGHGSILSSFLEEGGDFESLTDDDLRLDTSGLSHTFRLTLCMMQMTQ